MQLLNDPQKLANADDDTQTSAATRAYAPHLFVYASGEASAFELRLNRPQTRNELIMRGNILGEIEFGEDDEI